MSEPESTVKIRRAPKIGAFLVVGGLIGALVTLGPLALLQST